MDIDIERSHSLSLYSLNVTTILLGNVSVAKDAFRLNAFFRAEEEGPSVSTAAATGGALPVFDAHQLLLDASCLSLRLSVSRLLQQGDGSRSDAST